MYAEGNLLLVTSLIAFLFGVKGVANTFSRIPCGRIVDKNGYRWHIFLAFIMFSFAYLTISETENIYLLAVAMAVYGFANGMRAVTEWSFLGDLTNLRFVALQHRIFGTIFNIGTALGAIAEELSP